MNVDAMLQQISTRQFNEWGDYARVEPWDETRADLRAASVVQMLANVNRRKGQAPVKLEDCTLRFGAPVSAEPPADRARHGLGLWIAAVKAAQKAQKPRRNR